MRILELEEFVAMLPRMTGAATSRRMSWLCATKNKIPIKGTRTSICGRFERHRNKSREVKAKVT